MCLLYWTVAFVFLGNWFLIINVGRTLILGLLQTKWPHITYITLLRLISPPKRRQLAEQLMGVRETGKVPNRKVAKSWIVLVLNKSFALIYLSRYSKSHSKNNTNELFLLVSSAFSGRKESTKWHVSSFMACKLTTVAPYGVSISSLLISDYGQFTLNFMKNRNSLKHFHSPVL